MHEKQSQAIRDIENRLTKIETLLEERNRKSDEMFAMIAAMSTKLDNLPAQYVTRREFDAFKDGLKETSTAKYEGIKSWHAVVLGIVMLILGVIINWKH